MAFHWQKGIGIYSFRATQLSMSMWASPKSKVWWPESSMQRCLFPTWLGKWRRCEGRSSTNDPQTNSSWCSTWRTPSSRTSKAKVILTSLEKQKVLLMDCFTEKPKHLSILKECSVKCKRICDKAIHLVEEEVLMEN